MSISHSIGKLIAIQDANIVFNEEFFHMGTFKGEKCKFISGKLSYTPTHCEACGVENQNETIYKNGSQTSRITWHFIGMYPAYLL